MAIQVRRTKAKDPKGGVVAFSDGNDDAEVYISPLGMTQIKVGESVHSSPFRCSRG
jgi:hypothetical protein